MYHFVHQLCFFVVVFSDMSIPFSQWTKEQVCGWLEDYGLGQYVNLTRQWVENGQTLLSATPQDFEKVRKGKKTKKTLMPHTYDLVLRVKNMYQAKLNCMVCE